jgi:hypothetical protein
MKPEAAVRAAIRYFKQVQVAEKFAGLFVEGVMPSRDPDGGWDVTLSYSITPKGDPFAKSGLPPPRRRSVVQVDGEGRFRGLTAVQT